MPEIIVWICGECQSQYKTDKIRVSDICVVCKAVELVPVLNTKISKVQTYLNEKQKSAVVSVSVFE